MFFIIINRCGVSEIRLQKISSLRDYFESSNITIDSKASGFRLKSYVKVIDKEDFIIADIVRKYQGIIFCLY